MPFEESLSGKRVTVMGLGAFGGGIGAVRFLLDAGAHVTLTDLKTAEQLQGSLQQLDCDRLTKLVLGEHREEDFTVTDLIIVNPAVNRAGNRFLALAAERGIPCSSEINLFWERCQGRKIVVTGSTGKSTTATLIHACLKTAGLPCRLGGNLGVSLLPEVGEITPEEWVVLELSSFQLADLDRLQPRPEISVVTNFFANHLDWHGTLESYREAKQAALCWQTSSDIAVLNADESDLALWPTDARVIWFGHEVWRDRPGVHLSDAGIAVRSAAGGWLLEPADLAPCLRSAHGMMNAAAALATVAVGLEIPVPEFASALAGYTPLPHRLQVVGQIAERTIIDDSKATTPEAAMAGLQSLSQPIVLIAGGKDKGVDLSPLAEKIAHQAKALALLGDTARELENAVQAVLAANPAGRSLPIRCCSSMNEAVQWAWQQSAPGDVVLLSPGCASDAEFANYEQRGEKFIAAVERSAAGTSHH